MKKIFICIALAATVLNGVLASVGNGLFPTSELNMADVENVAEGGTEIAISATLLAAVGSCVGTIAGGVIVYYIVTGGGEWVFEYRDGIPIKATCVRCSIFNDDDCDPGTVWNF